MVYNYRYNTLMKSALNNSNLLLVSQTDEGLRLEVWLAKHVPELSRRKAVELIRDGLVRVNGYRVKKGVRVSAGQTIEIPIPHAHTHPPRRTGTHTYKGSRPIVLSI